MCKIPPPAVIHCVAPSVIRPPPPWESWWAKVPSIMYVDRLEAAMRVPRCSLRLAGRVVHLAHLVHVHEGVEVTKLRPANARRTGKPSPSNPLGAVVTDLTGRSTEWSAVERRDLRVAAKDH